MSSPPRKNQNARTIEAVETSCDIIDALQELNGGGVTELARHLDLSKAAVYSHLHTLRERDLVVKEDEHYRLSLRLLDYGRYVRSQVEIYDIVVSEVDRIAERTGEVSSFMVEEDGRAVYLHRARGSNAVKTASHIGQRKILHCTALGKAILSQLDRTYVDEILDRHGMPQYTEQTITDRDELFAELDQIREAGIAHDEEEILKGMYCIAAPVTNANDEVLGAVSATVPISRVHDEGVMEDLIDNIVHASNVIEVHVNVSDL